jgi:hypothetical protein
MKYLLLILVLTLVGCKKPEPKFFYGEEVTINYGFYKGCKAELRDFGRGEPLYYVHMKYECGYERGWMYTDQLSKDQK